MYVGLDIGGTNIRIALTEDLATPSLSLIRKIPATNNYTQDIEKKIKQRIRIRIYPTPQVDVTTLRDNLGILGAFALLTV